MVSIASLWLPIFVSAIGIWIMSAIVWMVLPYHKNDYAGLPDEEAARAVLRDLPPGQYNIPHYDDRKDMATPEAHQKCEDGPVLLMNVMPKGLPNMGKSLGQWFALNLFIAGLTAYVASRTLDPGAAYLSVFQIVATVTWAAYGMGAIQNAIWFGVKWSNGFKQLLDAFWYGLIAGGVFGAFWP